MTSWLGKDEYDRLIDGLAQQDALREIGPTLEAAQRIQQMPTPAPSIARSEPTLFPALDLGSLMGGTDAESPLHEPSGPFRSLDLDWLMQRASPRPTPTPTPDVNAPDESTGRSALDVASAPVSPYRGALTALGGTPEAEELTQPGGPSYVAPPAGEQPASGSPGVPLDTSSQAAYAASLMANAAPIAAKYDLPASVIAAIPVQEGGWGGSGLQRDANNLFSIKGSGPNGSQHYGGVWEVINGQDVYVPADFRRYHSPQESFEDFAKFLYENERYGPALKLWRETRDPSAFAQSLNDAGYATDPTWGRKVAAIAEMMPEPPQQASEPNRPVAAFKGGSYDDAVAADREFAGRAGMEQRDIRGDYAPVQEGPPVPYGVGDNLDPGDFPIPGRELAPVTASPLAQPGDAVEPGSDILQSEPEAPASPGDRIKQIFSDFGQQLGNLFSGPTRDDLAGAAQSIQQRQATLPGTPEAEALNATPWPFEQAAETAGNIATGAGNALVTGVQVADAIADLPGNMAIDVGSKYLRLQEINAKRLRAQLSDPQRWLSERDPNIGLTPEESAEAQGLAIELSQLGNLPSGDIGPKANFATTSEEALARLGRQGAAPSPIASGITYPLPSAERVGELNAGWARERELNILTSMSRGATREEAEKIWGPAHRETVSAAYRRDYDALPDAWAQRGDNLSLDTGPESATRGGPAADMRGVRESRPLEQSGGIVEGPRAPGNAGVVGRAAGSGVGAAYDESQREGSTPESVLQAGIGGAAVGLLNGSVQPGSRGAQVARAVQRVATPWETVYDKPMQHPPDTTSGISKVEQLRRAFVRAWTDDRVDLGEVQREAQRVLGRPLDADEMVLELSRRNPTAAADVAVKSGQLREAVQMVDGDTETLGQILTYRNMDDIAKAQNNPDRKFSGGLTVQDARQRLQWLQQNMAPAEWQRYDDATAKIRDFVEEYRVRMRDAGVWSDELYTDLSSKYPNYVPTKIVEYLKDPERAIANGRSLSLRDRGLRALTEEGTTAERENPLASLIRYAFDAEQIIAKNETYNAFVKLANEAPGVIPLTPVPTSYVAKAGEKVITGFENGVRTSYATPAPIAAVVQMEAGLQMPRAVSGATALFRELITRSPVFVAGQIPLDAMSYAVRTVAREHGNVPRVAIELAKAYRDAFQGLFSGDVRGDLARILREGGGMAGVHDRTARAMATTLDDLTRKNMLQVRSLDDLKRLGVWLATAEWSQAVGQRVEMAPRLAAGRLAERRALQAGASAEAAALKGVSDFRDVTLDFQRGGTWARTLNQLVPFFNVGWQSAATTARAVREHPKSFPLTALGLIGAPAVAAEAWNQSDPQRARDYADVPDYVKDRGIVIMLPGVEGTDSQGNRRPNYALIPLRELAPFAIVAREAARKAMGKDTEGWGALIGASVSAASPIQANNPGDFFNTFTPLGASTGLQLANNRDVFRSRTIATERNDQEAAVLSQGLADLFGGRPSQWEFAIRDLGGHAGASVLAASNMATGRQGPQSGGPQDLPLVGGLARRFVGNSIGQGLQDARDAMIAPSVRDALKDAGMRDDQVTGVPSTIKVRGIDYQLTREQQATAQDLMNGYLEREVAAALRSPEYRNPRSDHQQMIRDAATRARRLALDRVGQHIAPQQRKAS